MGHRSDPLCLCSLLPAVASGLNIGHWQERPPITISYSFYLDREWEGHQRRTQTQALAALFYEEALHQQT